MAQRRDDRSDLDDVKALAAKARETGGPVLRPNPAELSGVRPRRDSVIGMRLTPPPRAAGGGDLPNWFWGVLGCLSVLLVGFVGLFVLGRAGKLGALMGDTASLGGPPAAPAPAPPALAAEPALKEPEAPAPAEHRATTERAGRPEHRAREAAPAERPAPAAPVEAPAAAAAPAENAPVAAEEPAKRVARVAAPKPHAKESEAPAAADDESAGGEPAEAKTRPARAAAAAPKPAAEEAADDDQSPPGQDEVERALDALAPRVRGCFVKYQIKGTARVRLVATPVGKAESVSVTGDFEDTPTGLCVESIVTEAKLPSFKGPPLKLSQSYQLR